MAHHVFVETNWVVDHAAPVLSRNPAASELLGRARSGELVLNVPAISLVEARKVIRERSQRDYLNSIRAFILMTRDGGQMMAQEADAAFAMLGRYEQFIAREKGGAPARIAGLLSDQVVRVFPLDDEMLGFSLDIAAKTTLELQSFDMAILAAVLVEGSRLREQGHTVSFCTLDTHLQPWDRMGASKPELVRLYESCGVWVHGDFLLESPARPEGWPGE